MEEEPQLRREPARPSKRIHSSGDEGSSQKKKSTNADVCTLNSLACVSHILTLLPISANLPFGLLYSSQRIIWGKH